MEAYVRIFGVLFVPALGICFGLEICTLKEAFEKHVVHSVNFLVACITKTLAIQVGKSTCLFDCKSLFLQTPKFLLKIILNLNLNYLLASPTWFF